MALGWANVTTLAGSWASPWPAQALLITLTGAGLVTADVAAQASFALAVALGAALTRAIATWRGLPVSTTHVSVRTFAGARAGGGHGGVDRRVMKGIVWSWVLTLPIGAAFGALLYAGISWLLPRSA